MNHIREYPCEEPLNLEVGVDSGNLSVLFLELFNVVQDSAGLLFRHI
jgi:hypothetical protein